MNKIFGLSLLIASAVAMPLVKADLIPTAKPIVKISLPRVLEIMGQLKEAERQNEMPGALYLYPLEARLETLMLQLKNFIKQYEAEEKVRIDITALDEDVLDYTDDFLEKMRTRSFEDD